MTQMVYLVAKKLIVKNRLYLFLYWVVSPYCCFMSHVGQHLSQIHRILNLGMIYFKNRTTAAIFNCIFAFTLNENIGFFQ